MFGDFQSLLATALGVGAIGLGGFALLDAIRVHGHAFPAAGKLTKPIWLAILGVALAIAIILFRNPLNIFSLMGVIAASVYLVDVRPAVRAAGGGRRGSRSQDGPYGPW